MQEDCVGRKEVEFPIKVAKGEGGLKEGSEKKTV